MGNKLGIYFPKDKQFYKKGELILLKLNKSPKFIEFITKFNYNLIIRKEFVDRLNLRKNDEVIIEFDRIKNLQRTKNLFYKDKIDLLSLIPEKTSKNYEIIVSNIFKDNEEWLRLWYYHNRGSGRQLELKRFIDIEIFGKLLGQYQAEGTKNKENKKSNIEFTNKLIKEHIDYLSYLYELGIKKENLEFRFVYNPKKLKQKELETYIKEFHDTINLPIKINISEKIKGKAFKNIIRNTLLAEVIIGSMNKIRKFLAQKRIYDILEAKLANNFLSKLLTGDGTLDIRIKNRAYNFPYTRLKIVDQNLDYLNDYKLIIDNLGFNAKVDERNILVKAGVPFNKLFYLYKIKAFKNTNNWNKLIALIKIYLNGRRLKVKYNNFDDPDFINWQKDLFKLKEEKQIQDPNLLLESLKTKFASSKQT